MEIFKSKSDLITFVDVLKSEERTLGFVPTMGALHEGHLSLLKEGLDENDVVVVSIFVNPTQFDNADDLSKYPRTLDVDLNLLSTIAKDRIIVFVPTVTDIYGEHVSATSFSYDGLEHEMEGRFRAGHFDGVGTIVKRLFEIIRPDSAYFGEKDFQQLLIIKKLVSKYDIPVKVVGCKIHRDSDGLAMSSRNARLKPNYREAAPFIYSTLKTAKEKFRTESAHAITEWVTTQFDAHDLLTLEYFIIADIETLKTVEIKSKQKLYRAFIAVYADDIRLIDNIALN
jgi:pantoate--beta-alanine ligase